MSGKELLSKVLLRLNKFKLLILLGGILMAVLLYMYGRTLPTVYSVKSTLYPLTAGPENTSTSNKLSELLGAGSASKSLSDEANVNIEEVAKSKKTRESVVKERLPQYGNKTVAEVLIHEQNKYLSFGTPKAIIPKLEKDLYSQGAAILKSKFTVKFNKFNLLEIVMSNTDPNLITPISYILTDKISQFYKELKIKKAQFDYDFTQRKVDSLDRLLRMFDSRRVVLSKTTLFVPNGRLQYIVPKEKIEMDRQLVISQRNGAASNREEALWRKQRVTPIVEMLDKPEPPFDTVAPSKKIYAIGGFLIGVLLLALICISGLLYKFAKLQLNGIIKQTIIIPESNISTTASTTV